MARPLYYQRYFVDRSSVLTESAFIETVIYFAPSLSYQYHVFFIKNGMIVKKKYCKTENGSKRVCKKNLKERVQS